MKEPYLLHLNFTCKDLFFAMIVCLTNWSAKSSLQLVGVNSYLR